MLPLISILYLVSAKKNVMFPLMCFYNCIVCTLGEEPKGKDFDLKKIRSELKMPVDIASTVAVKASSPVPPPLPPPQTPSTVPTTTPSIPTASPPAQQPVDSLASGPGGGDDDIYEFREPEPFEFEVRARRESPFNEDRVHHRFVQRKSTKEEEDEPSPKKPTTVPVVISLLY